MVRLHVEARDCASKPCAFETILISILIEQGKLLVELREKIRGYEEQVNR